MLLIGGAAFAAPPPLDDDHYMIVVLVWDNETGELEAGVPVTFAGSHTLYSESDGSVVYDTANLDNIEHGQSVEVCCEYGSEQAPIILYTDEQIYNETSQQHETTRVREWGTTVTFNAPSEEVAIATLAKMGLAVSVVLGGGIYLIRRKKRHIQEDTMTGEETGAKSKLARDFGVRALIATLLIIGFVLITAIAVYQNNTDMIDPIVNWYMPLLLAVVSFYYAGSLVKQSQ
jgi:hypothetical protein